MGTMEWGAGGRREKLGCLVEMLEVWKLPRTICIARLIGGLGAMMGKWEHQSEVGGNVVVGLGLRYTMLGWRR